MRRLGQRQESYRLQAMRPQKHGLCSAGKERSFGGMAQDGNVRDAREAGNQVEMLFP